MPEDDELEQDRPSSIDRNEMLPLGQRVYTLDFEHGSAPLTEDQHTAIQAEILRTMDGYCARQVEVASEYQSTMEAATVTLGDLVELRHQMLNGFEPPSLLRHPGCVYCEGLARHPSLYQALNREGRNELARQDPIYLPDLRRGSQEENRAIQAGEVAVPLPASFEGVSLQHAAILDGTGVEPGDVVGYVIRGMQADMINPAMYELQVAGIVTREQAELTGCGIAAQLQEDGTIVASIPPSSEGYRQLRAYQDQYNREPPARTSEQQAAARIALNQQVQQLSAYEAAMYQFQLAQLSDQHLTLEEETALIRRIAGVAETKPTPLPAELLPRLCQDDILLSLHEDRRAGDESSTLLLTHEAAADVVFGPRIPYWRCTYREYDGARPCAAEIKWGGADKFIISEGWYHSQNFRWKSHEPIPASDADPDKAPPD